jgi:hypothetical protein
MKGMWNGLIVIAIISLLNPIAEAQLFTGRDLLAGWKAVQRMEAGQAGPAEREMASNYVGYLRGFGDAAAHYTKRSSIYAVVTDADICRVVGKYLDEHPERLREFSGYLVADALNQAFPQAFPKVPKKKR